MTELRETIINVIGFGVLGKNTYGEIADAVLAAITEAGYEIVASLPAWAILPNETLIERMGGRSLDPKP